MVPCFLTDPGPPTDLCTQMVPCLHKEPYLLCFQMDHSIHLQRQMMDPSIHLQRQMMDPFIHLQYQVIDPWIQLPCQMMDSSIHLQCQMDISEDQCIQIPTTVPVYHHMATLI